MDLLLNFINENIIYILPSHFLQSFKFKENYIYLIYCNFKIIIYFSKIKILEKTLLK